MHIGIFVFEIDTSLDPAVLAKRAEDLGFESFWVQRSVNLVIQLIAVMPRFGDQRGLLFSGLDIAGAAGAAAVARLLPSRTDRPLLERILIRCKRGDHGRRNICVRD